VLTHAHIHIGARHAALPIHGRRSRHSGVVGLSSTLPSPLPILSSEQEFISAFRASAGNAVVLLMNEGCDRGPAVAAELMKRRMALQLASMPEEDGLSVQHHSICFSVGDATRHVADGLGVTRMPHVLVYDRNERVLTFPAETPGALFYGLQEAASLVDARQEPPQPI